MSKIVKKSSIHISKKKTFFTISDSLEAYLRKYERMVSLPIQYNELTHYSSSFPLINKKGQDTLWETVMYEHDTMKELNRKLTKIYSLLKTAGDTSVMEHLFVDRIDYCTFGNSNPFRIRIKNHYNDNYDYFYLKRADASRIYGLELEHILSPNRINYMVEKETLIEEHIAGIPGDQFIQEYLSRETTNKVRLAKEFVKFNERCFIRLLGDMRAYNFVIDITPDFEEEQYRIRAIDFDQQSYEGNYKIYLPQFFKENYLFVKQCIDLLPPKTVKQYQQEERTLMAKRILSSKYKLKDLLDTMRKDKISEQEKIKILKVQLNEYYSENAFSLCKSMGDILRTHLKIALKNTTI